MAIGTLFAYGACDGHGAHARANNWHCIPRARVLRPVSRAGWHPPASQFSPSSTSARPRVADGRKPWTPRELRRSPLVAACATSLLQQTPSATPVLRSASAPATTIYPFILRRCGLFDVAIQCSVPLSESGAEGLLEGCLDRPTWAESSQGNMPPCDMCCICLRTQPAVARLS